MPTFRRLCQRPPKPLNFRQLCIFCCLPLLPSVTPKPQASPRTIHRMSHAFWSMTPQLPTYYLFFHTSCFLLPLCCICTHVFQAGGSTFSFQFKSSFSYFLIRGINFTKIYIFSIRLFSFLSPFFFSIPILLPIHNLFITIATPFHSRLLRCTFLPFASTSCKVDSSCSDLPLAYWYIYCPQNKICSVGNHSHFTRTLPSSLLRWLQQPSFIFAFFCFLSPHVSSLLLLCFFFLWGFFEQ